MGTREYGEPYSSKFLRARAQTTKCGQSKINKRTVFWQMEHALECPRSRCGTRRARAALGACAGATLAARGGSRGGGGCCRCRGRGGAEAGDELDLANTGTAEVTRALVDVGTLDPVACGNAQTRVLGRRAQPLEAVCEDAAVADGALADEDAHSGLVSARHSRRGDVGRGLLPGPRGVGCRGCTGMWTW